MNIRTHITNLTVGTAAAMLVAGTASAETPEDYSLESNPAEAEASVTQQSGPPSAGGPPPGIPIEKTVFDETWATVGIGAGLVPSYSGSDEYRLFPLPLVVGRVGGIGITPNGPGFVLNVLSQAPSRNPAKVSASFGPAFRLRNDRDGNVEDAVVELAAPLETAFELGVSGGVSVSGVFNQFDSLSFSTQIRWDILGAHDGMLVEPGIAYFTPIGPGAALQLTGNLGFVDDNFADYYYTVTPAQSAATGLPQFTANGGLNSVGSLAILTIDLDGDARNGGLVVYTIGGYSRLVGDAADTPFTAIRGSADQFIGGMGLGYTF